MEKIAILFGSSTGNTESVAEIIADKIGNENVVVFNIADISVSEIQLYKNLIFGASTWGIGELQDDWDTFLPHLASEDLSGKKVAFFGLGDAESYGDSFVDAMGLIYEEIKDKGAEIIGQVSTTEYNFDDSRAVFDGKFIGLPLDEDNEDNLTDNRIDNWLKELLPKFN